MWDPAAYLRFDDHRSRPFHELLARVPLAGPRRVVDVGCGPGHLTRVLSERWPDAAVEGLDSSPQMVEEARRRGVNARQADVTSWIPEPDTDMVISNAVLQWVEGHDDVLRTWVRALPSGAVVAVQVPGNFTFPSHVLIRELAASDRWAEALRDVRLRGPDAVAEPEDYARLLAAEGTQVDAWETTYLQRMAGEDPVLEWVSGTALRPVRQALTDQDWQDFRGDLAPALRGAYPASPDGSTWFPFRRIFMVARVA